MTTVSQRLKNEFKQLVDGEVLKIYSPDMVYFIQE